MYPYAFDVVGNGNGRPLLSDWFSKLTEELNGESAAGDQSTKTVVFSRNPGCGGGVRHVPSVYEDLHLELSSQ
jgi:hypothetical protein